MSKIERLIEELCPDGVEYKKIKDIANYEQPSKYLVKSTEYKDSNKIPVLTAGQTFILGYTDETKGIYCASKKEPVIIFDDFTGAFKWVDFPFKAKSSAMKMITVKKGFLIRYLYHIMGYLNFSSNEHKRLWINKYSELYIPVPPLPVQEEIVRILDSFTEKTNELKAKLEEELEARKKQYEWYRNVLLDLKNSAEIYRLRELVDFKNGKGHEKDIVSDGKYIVINSKFISSQGKVKKYTNKQICPLYKDDILMVMSDLPNGKALAKCFLVENNDRYTLNQRICSLNIKNSSLITTKFLYYILNRNYQLLRFDNGVDQTNLKKDNILDIIIPVPSLEEQQRIVDILDRFDKLCNDISEGLPAEIDARQKQYEYYRDKLLTFKRLEDREGIEDERV